MNLHINGEPIALDLPGQPPVLPDVIVALGLTPSLLLVEHNGIALHQSEWDNRPVAEGDRLEILRIAAGG